MEDMTTYASPKAALLAAGKITAITKGRISNDNNAWLAAEVSAGRIAIVKDNAPKRTAPVGKDKPAAKVMPVGKDLRDFTILYHKDDYHALGADGKRYGMAEVCNTCRVSLVQNLCENPTILGGISVKITPNA